MREVSERTFKAYAREAVKELNKTELTATVKFYLDGVDIRLFRDGHNVGCVFIYTDGEVEVKGETTGAEIEINPLHNTMKDVFKAIPEAVNAHLDENGFMFEEQETDEPQPTPEDADKEVVYVDFRPEADFSEEEKKEITETVADIGLEMLEQELTELEKLEEESDKADDAWDKDPMNAELEEASRKAYEREWKKYMDAAKTLARLIDMDTKTARQMLQRGSKNRQKVWSYLIRRKAYENR